MTTNTLSVFNFNSSDVRTLVMDDAPWFIASDVCKALGYKNTSDAVGTHLDDDERSTIANSDSRNGGGSLVVINESGLYALVLRSRKPEARKFAKWVTSEVLPAIRKTGKYEIGTVTVQQYGELATRIAERFPDGKHRPYAWSRFNNHFRIASYKDLPASRYEDGLAYIEALPVKKESEAIKQYAEANQVSLVDIKAVLTTGLSEPTLPLSDDLQRAINQKSFAVAHEFFETFQQHLARQVAFRCEYGQPRQLDERKAMQIIDETTIDSALTHRYYGLLSGVHSMSESLAMMADKYSKDIGKVIHKKPQALIAA